MSPQTKIKELDGLPAGEIQLLVANSERRTVDLMERKFEENRALIEGRLDAQASRSVWTSRLINSTSGMMEISPIAMT